MIVTPQNHNKSYKILKLSQCCVRNVDNLYLFILFIYFYKGLICSVPCKLICGINSLDTDL